MSKPLAHRDGEGRSGEPVRFREVFNVPEYRRLWGATVVSELGDQPARVAVVVLVFP